MKQNSDTIQKAFSNPIAENLLKKLLVLFVVLYVFLFGAETILPGIIMDVFNLNILLSAVIANLLLLGFFPAGHSIESAGISRTVRKLKIPLMRAVVFFLSAVFLIALYRVSLAEGLIYLILALAIGKLLFGFLRE